MQTLSLRVRPSSLSGRQSQKSRSGARHQVLVRAEGPKIVREYREDDDKLINNPSEASSPNANTNPNSAYIDDLPETPRREMSAAQKAKLRAEYLSLGGSPNTKMGSNWFLIISGIIAGLAITSALLGYLG
ncbi:hypothetical protein Ndes2526B_g01971 [Nannochloris sp. 'desiccata']